MNKIVFFCFLVVCPLKKNEPLAKKQVNFQNLQVALISGFVSKSVTLYPTTVLLLYTKVSGLSHESKCSHTRVSVHVRRMGSRC